MSVDYHLIYRLNSEARNNRFLLIKKKAEKETKSKNKIKLKTNTSKRIDLIYIWKLRLLTNRNMPKQVHQVSTKLEFSMKICNTL